MEINKVYNIDAFDLVKELDDESVDLIIVDPPYGDNFTYGKLNKTIIGNEDEGINYKYMDAVYPKLKNDKTMYIFTNHKFVDLLKHHALDTGWSYRTTIVLVKNNFGLGFGFRNQHEMCLVLEKGKPKYNLKNFTNVIQMKHINHQPDSHPHAKEWDVIRKMILHSSEVGDLVLDNFMGSFTTAKACFKENRDFIGTELDPKWFKKYEKELDALMNQTTLF